MSDTEDLFTAMSPAPAEIVSPPAPPLAPREIWTFRDLLLFIAFLPCALLAANLLALVGYVMLRPFMGWRTRVESLPHNTFFILMLQCLLYFFVVGYLVMIARIRHHQPFWRALGWQTPTAGKILWYLAGGGLLAVAINLAPTLLPDAPEFPLEQLFTTPAASYAIGVFAIVVAPVVEEVVFRGLLFAIFESTVGLPFAIAVTATLFAALHIQEYWHAWNHLLMIFVVGVVFSVARGKSGSLTPSVFLHVGYNACMMVSLFVSSKHFQSMNVYLGR